MLKLAICFVMMATANLLSRPPLSKAEIIDSSLESHKDDSKGVFEMVIPFTPKEFFPVLLEILKSKGAIKISDSRYDIRKYMESAGAEFGPDGVAVADKEEHLLYFRDTGKRLYLIASLWRPAFPSVYRKAEHASPANRHPFGTSVMLPADPAARAGSTPEASGDS